MVDRIFDVEFAPVDLTVNRLAPSAIPSPTGVEWSGPGADEELLYADQEGRAVFYKQIDLSQLTKEGLAFKPLSINVQRPYDDPAGQDANYMPSTSCTELIYVFLNPLANSEIRAGININSFRDLGLDLSDMYGGAGAPKWGEAIPNSSNTLFAQQTRYLNNLSNSTTAYNDMAHTTDVYYPLLSTEMTKVEQNTWGGMHTLLGPMLHCYRVIIHPTQVLTGLGISNPIRAANGFTLRKFSPISVQIYAEEQDLSEGAYIIEASNAFNNENFNSPSNR
jgi:hypothetical protein